MKGSSPDVFDQQCVRSFNSELVVVSKLTRSCPLFVSAASDGQDRRYQRYLRNLCVPFLFVTRFFRKVFPDEGVPQ